MGFFTRKDSQTAPPKSSSSLAAPPNAHASSHPSPPKLPNRPATTTPSSRRQEHSSHHRRDHRDAARPRPHLHEPTAGYPAPSGWGPGPAPAAPPAPQPPYQHQQQRQQPVIVNQNYYIGGQGHRFQIQNRSQPQLQLPPLDSVQAGLGKWTASMVNLARDARDFIPVRDWAPNNCCPKLFEDIASRLDNIMTLIDCEKCPGDDRALFTYEPAPSPPEQQLVSADRALAVRSRRPSNNRDPKPHSSSPATSVASGSYFSKVELYANSKLPPNLTPLAVYMPTWPLLCLAAQSSQSVYEKPTGHERNETLSSGWRTGSKAMCIKSVPMDHVNTIVFAIRGTATFMDWAVNLKSAPASPDGFLDDEGNYCHAGFLSVARKMVKPVAERIRQMLQEDPGRASYSLLMTGHSAGGAVAALLYSHMLSTSPRVESELNMLTGCFKRIHCVTFGSPPVSLLPLTKPNRPELRKSLFLSFVNEGDPVVRADKPYVKSLLELLATPPPPTSSSSSQPKDSSSRDRPSNTHPSPPSSKPKKPKARPTTAPKLPRRPNEAASPPRPTWRVPPSTLSNAGRIVVLRSASPSRSRRKDQKTVDDRLKEGVVAVTCSEDLLRDMIWGDPVCHIMSLYAARIEVLAVNAVTAGHAR